MSEPDDPAEFHCPQGRAAPQPSVPIASSPWSPLRQRIFRWLWIATVTSNLGTWLQNTGASWQMTSLTESTTLVALVQVATNLPNFLLALPAGALADVVDRRKLLLFTQSWMAVAAAGLGTLAITGMITPWVILSFTLLLGVGAAVNGPAWRAIIPDLVPREQLPAAIALGSMGFNIGRAAGPALGGLIVATAGAGWTFFLNALSFLGVVTVLYIWRSPEIAVSASNERLLAAIGTGMRYVRQSREAMAVMVRASVFFLCGSSLWALLPVVARELQHGPTGYGLLLAALGLGAVAGAMFLPLILRSRSTDCVVGIATLVFAGNTATLALANNFWLVGGAMVLAGAAWFTVLSTFNVTLQTLLPAWVRARVLSVYLLVFFGAQAAGSSLWGVVADRLAVRPALVASAAGVVLGLLATSRRSLRPREDLP